MCGYAQTDTIVYPSVSHSADKDTFWGAEISDPYRLLETNGPTQRQWLEDEKKITAAYFKKIKHKSDYESDYNMLLTFTYNIPRRSGPYYIEGVRDGAASDAVSIYYKESLREESKLLLSPKAVATDLSAFKETQVSRDGKFMAFSYSRHGSDWETIGVYDIKKQKLLNDYISNVRYSTITWRGTGFYYFRYDSVDDQHRYTDVQYNQKIYYHTIGTGQDQDSLVYQDEDYPLNIFRLQVVGGERFLVIRELDLLSGKSIFKFKDLTAADAPFTSYSLREGADMTVVGSNGDDLYVMYHSEEFYNGGILALDSKSPKEWQIVISNQKDFMMEDACFLKDKFYIVMQHEFAQVIVIYSDSGNILKQIVRPTGSNTNIVSYAPEEDALVLAQNYYICPRIGELLSLKDNSLRDLEKTRVMFDPFNYLFTTTTYYAADSTPIPIYIVRNKEYLKKGPRPTLLKVYGGFGITSPVSYDPGLLIFLGNGGTFAYANVRGGSNSVKDWHKMGALLNKHNTFDDTYLAAKFMVDSGYAEKGKIAITGGSNGGLVGAAVVNSHPEYFKVAILSVGVYDMLRAEKFTVGAYHLNEFGTVRNPITFKNLLSYSPLHNIKPNTEYPSMLITTSEYDDRVPPMHSYKYVAALQELTKSKNPILLRIEQNAGHNGSNSTERQAISNRDFYSFLLKELGLKYKAYAFY